MIVRYESDGSIVMITQNDHAQLSGLFAAHWGNDTFQKPQPYASLVRAAMFHDRGWIRYETAPQLNPETGKTPNYREVPNDRTQLEAFEWAGDWLSAIDPYAGLMIAKHRSGLWQGRYGVIAHPPAIQRGKLAPEILAFIARSEAKQKVAAPVSGAIALAPGQSIPLPAGLGDLKLVGVRERDCFLRVGQSSEDWAVAGTTGYGFLNVVAGLFVDPRHVRKLRRIYTRLTGRTEPFEEVAYRARLTVMRTAMASELNVLAHTLNRLSETDRGTRDFTDTPSWLPSLVHQAKCCAQRRARSTPRCIGWRNRAGFAPSGSRKTPVAVPASTN